MLIYDKVKRFDSITGKPTEKWTFKEIRCDYTGTVLENYYCAYNLDYGDQDQCFGAGDEEFKLGRDLKIDMFQFLSQTYYFSLDGAECAEFQMMEEAIKNCKNPKSEWYRCNTFDSICRRSRIKTARKLVEDNIIAPDQLELDHN